MAATEEPLQRPARSLEETFGRYRLLARLGQGGMAEVFKAKSFGVEGFEKVLVIKRILPDLARSKAFVEMFVHEAKLAVRLSHANIVQVFDLGKVGEGPDPSYFIAMEYVAGMDLSTLLMRCRRQGLALPAGMCVYVAGEVAKGLDHAHRRRDEQGRPLGIVHRDVSPQNVLLSWEGEVKVTDFGIAKARDTIDEAGADADRRQVKGKYSYMSPEQARGEPVDARSDLFSLGTVLYEMIAATNPFSAPTAFETLRRVQAAEFPPVELLRPDIPRDLGALVHRTLSRDAHGRPPNAGRLYEDLLAYLYASGERFGAHDLAEWLGRFRVEDAAPAVPAERALEEEQASAARDRTPVEVPVSSPASSVVRREGSDAAVASLRATAAAGERREATVLVLSFPARAKPPSDEARATATTILARYGARLVDDERTQMVALFGVGDTDGRDTETAIRCALVLLRALGGGQDAPSAGVHAARILVDAEGDPVRDPRLASAVGTAQTMASLADGRCGVSSEAARSTRDVFRFEPAPEGPHAHEARGATIAVEVRPPEEAAGRFAGRKDELRRFGELMAMAQRRKLVVITVRGDQGIGKTRLLQEIHRRMQRGGWTVGFWLATCPPRGRGLPLSGLTAMLQTLCGIQEGDPDERIAAVEPRLRALGLHDEEVRAVLSQLGHHAGTGASMPALRAGFARMLASLCEDRMHVFAWDNASMLDEASFEVLAAVAQRVWAVRAVLVFAARPELEHPLERHPQHAVISLGELGEEDASHLVALRTGATQAPPALVEFCRRRAGGHPMFIEELVRELVASGAVVVENGKVVRHDLEGEVSVPRPLRTLVASRVARVSPDERAVLQAAAIAGDPVGCDVLAAMLDLSHAQVDKIAAALAQRDLVRRMGPQAIAYASPILREVLVDAMPAEVQREMHAAAGTAVERVLGERAVEQADRVAHHFYEAGDRDRAAVYYARSGRRRLRAGKYEAAARDMARALDLCDTSRHRADELAGWVADLAAAVHRVRAAPELPHLVARLLERIDAEGALATRVGARVDFARALGSTHLFEAAEDHLRAAHALAGDDAGLVQRVLFAEAEVAMRRGDFGRALDRFTVLQGLESGDRAEEHRILLGFAHSHAARGDREGAMAAVDQAVALLPPDDLAAACEREKVRALVHYFTRDFDACARTSERAAEIARQAGLNYEVAINLHNLGDALVRLGELPRAYASFQQSLALCEEVAQDRMAAQNRAYLAYLDAVGGVAGADRTVREYVAWAEGQRYAWDAVNGRWLLAELLDRRGDREGACAEYERCGAAARAIGFRMVEEDCAAGLAAIEKRP